MEDGNGGLFETERRGKMKTLLYRGFAATVLVSIIWIWIYRARQLPALMAVSGSRKWAVMGMFGVEVVFGVYWVVTQSVRWNPVYRRTFKRRLSQRYEKKLPGVDIFVCTANPEIEPPIMVVNTVLSLMAYDYPPEKLAVYLSDDGGSELTFYALNQAALFSMHWLPYCRNHNIQPRSPAAYFKSTLNSNQDQDYMLIRRLYEDMKDRIEDVTKIGRVPEEFRNHGFTEWDSFTSPRDHDPIIQILLDKNKDTEGQILPKLVYMAREKRPHHFHNFKAGAMNALIRVSSVISNAPIILNVDCDMYSNSSDSIRDALCFFMDEDKGHEIAFVQFPQAFGNLTKNELYDGCHRVYFKVDFYGLDGLGGPLYIGTGCFHRRDILVGKTFNDGSKINWNNHQPTTENDHQETTESLIERTKSVASCTFENDTEWGKEIGLRYGCPVEDIRTGLAIHCRGWKSVFHNPERPAFLGLSGTTLDEVLVQHKRWSEGHLQNFFSKYHPDWYGLGKTNPGLLMGYLIYFFWAPSSLPSLYYFIVPSLYLLIGTSLFPPIWSLWFLPFAYIVVSVTTFDCLEFLWLGGTFRGWLNNLRMWFYKRTSSYLFAILDVIFGSNMSFVISSKVVDDDVHKRYEKEITEFGVVSSFSTLVATLSLVYLTCFLGFVIKSVSVVDTGTRIAYYETMALHIVLSVALMVLNLPVYSALFVRKDKGRIPSSVAIKSVSIALFVCTPCCFV